MSTYIIGHTKPDTDAVVAAMAYAHLCHQLECLNCSDATPLIADPLNPETSYLFDKFSLTPPKLIQDVALNPDDKVILVDHNEASQRPSAILDTHISEIIDHHKPNLNLTQPIFLTFKPWGSTSTIIYHRMKTHDITPDQPLASLMLAAILSDTVGFKSSTCTQKDKEFAQELSKIAKIDDLTAFTLEIFKAKSDISSLTDEQIITNDYKIFDFTQKTLINQLETVEQAHILQTKKANLLQAMQEVKRQQKVDLLFVAITDILQVNTKLLLPSAAEIAVAEKAFGGQATDKVLDIGPKLSRKKDIAPAIEKALS